MDPTYVLLAVIVVLIPLTVRAFSQVNKKCEHVTHRMIVVETMLAIYLEHEGFDMQKVTKAIREHSNEVNEDGSPQIGCINIKELYKDKEG